MWLRRNSGVKKLLAKLLPRWRSGLSVLLVLGVLGANFVAYQQARAMLRFVRAGERTASPEKLSLFAKARVLFTGVTLTRPENRVTPKDVGFTFETRRFAGANGIELEAWFVPAPRDATNGVVLLFHGYGASKAALLAPAKEFHTLGWATLLVDFHGSGGSAGDTTSIGWQEAEDVRAAFAEAARLVPDARACSTGLRWARWRACARYMHSACSRMR